MKHFDLDWNNNHRVWFPKSRLNLSKKKNYKNGKSVLSQYQTYRVNIIIRLLK